ncbi:hypothetical protein BST27_29660 [Mycobacterium intermedium]|uniref:Uncharacterized protein n=1 Tax=Mycobacterium intermedium TaxID=28445 RepID=A0A1E3SDU5_MYCIE|nr:hypothetical protein [Mycobacterium intermedium]MCV6965977.1 hypothetical protein [Mycobacterium intermedium]ODR00346.1 hypothetical protein BHQ20_13390 [Mycobacterium intermedium]OPE51052.1 hypothetical protein BV508_07755 [Mycobacterium intermedium]ORA90507.1 hypothetical protein BST27_29660 [Mycobacterium intermedium]
MTAPDLLPAIIFDPPQVPPNPYGLYSHVRWVQSGDPFRALLHQGVVIRPHNYGGEGAFGVWNAGWCEDPDSIAAEDRKHGTRPDAEELDPFTSETVYAFDHNACGDLSAEEIQATRDRALRNLLRLEQNAAERQLAVRMLADAGTPRATTDIVAALAHIETQFAITATAGFIHASSYWAAHAIRSQLAVRDGDRFVTPLGHTWVFGGGYADELDTVLVATSPIFGWRGETQINESIQHTTNEFIAVAERSVLLGYEKAVAAAEIETPEPAEP